MGAREVTVLKGECDPGVSIRLGAVKMVKYIFEVQAENVSSAHIYYSVNYLSVKSE